MERLRFERAAGTPADTLAPTRGRLASAFCLLLLSACAVAPVGPPHQLETHAIADPEASDLGRVFEAAARKHPGSSGFDLITSGRTAFEARYAFARLAQKTLDVQYFLWAGDATGRLMLQALLDAADRGVRVRLLLDDVNLGGKDLNLAILNAHRDIEVRLFNPFAFRAARFANYLVDFTRVNHRMHNKAFIIDNTIAIVGGRNIGDHYFSVSGESNFRDVDLFAAGPIVREASQLFDDFWNSPWTTTIGQLTSVRPTQTELRALEERVREKIADTDYPFKTKLDEPMLEHLVASVPGRLIWGKAALLADRPDKPATSEPELAEALRAKVHGSLGKELLLESAYFIPAGNGTTRLCELVRRGVRIRVLTNSLASTDEPAAYAGYSSYRDDLLRCGVELHELRPDAQFVRREWRWLHGRSEAELHTKAAVFDRRTVMIGSFNLDPRSRNLNTEMAFLVDSPTLAVKVADFITSGMALDNAYRLELDKSGCLVWVAREQEQNVLYDHAPAVDFWPRMGTWFLSLLPIDELL
jgi:cardiolipin synthase C